MQGAFWEASVHKGSKDRLLEHLLPVSYLVSASHQTFPPSSYPIPPISSSVLSRVQAVQLQPFSDCRLTVGSGSSIIPCLFLQPDCKSILREIYAFGKREGRTGREVLCYWKMDQETSPQLQPFLSCPSSGSDNFPFLPLAANPSIWLPSSPEATLLLQPMGGWRMSPVWCLHSCSSFGSWVCGLPHGLQWLTSWHVHMSNRVEEFSTRCRGLSIIPFNNAE